MAVRPALIPCLRYREAPAAIDFLCKAFGFTRHAVYTDEKDESYPGRGYTARDCDGYVLELRQLRPFRPDTGVLT